MVQKVPETQMNQTLNTVSVHTENIYAKNIVIVVIIIICLIPSKLKMTILMTVYRIEPSWLLFSLAVKVWIIVEVFKPLSNKRLEEKVLVMVGRLVDSSIYREDWYLH